MFRAAALLALLAASVVAAAPVPPPSAKDLIAKYWGKTEGAGQFELEGKQLTLRTAGQPARGFIHGTRTNMPRTMRTVQGDFAATVKIVDASAPDTKVRHEDAWPGTRTGLTVSGGGYSIEWHLYQYYTKLNGEVQGDLKRVVWVDTWFPGGGAGSSRAQVPADKSVYLRVARKNKSVTVSHSFDGKDWSAPVVPRQGLDFPDEVTVGAFFAHSTYQSAAATFDPMTVEKLK
ncbi:MAG TPA: hypothetical protein VGE74_03820 [Gemmata sp.]